MAIASSSSSGGGDGGGGSPTEEPESDKPTPTLSTVTGGEHGFPGTATSIDLAAAGYTEKEYFLSGEATAYEKVGAWDSNGHWSIQPTTTAPYTTRMLVRAPENPEHFNGTVLVEWLNVSGSADVDVDFALMHEEILRGYAWVGVSAQAAGIHATGGSPLGADVAGLKTWDPQRYAALDHPGDAYSYDMFSQAGQSLLNPGTVNPLAGIDITQLLATGQSQSAYRMLTYANSVQPVARLYDGLLIHSRSGTGAPLADGMSGGVPEPARVRTDLAVPVFQIEAETDMYGLSGGNLEASFPAARQPDTDKIRTWEVAGTAHSDATYLAILSAQGSRQYEQFMDLGPALAMVNNGPAHYVLSAALRSLRNWAGQGVLPPTAEPYKLAGDTLARDDNGNVLGGVRTPQLDAPVATLTGEGAALSGRTIPFDASVLATLYPTPDAYLDAYNVATDRAIDDGFMLADDEARIKAEGRANADTMAPA